MLIICLSHYYHAVMSEEETKSSQGMIFLAKEYKIWTKDIEGEYELFYDPLQKRIVILHEVDIYVFEKYDRMKDPNPIYFQLPSKHNDIDALAISHDDCYIAIQDNPSRIAFVDFGPVITEELTQRNSSQAKESEIDLDGSKGNIVGLTFMKSANFDFIIILEEGINLYKYNTKKRCLENPLKTISYSILNAFIDPLEGFVVLTSSKTKGEIFTFNLLKHDIKSKEIKGSTLHLMLRPFDLPSVTKAEKLQKDLIALKYYLEIPKPLTKNLKQYTKALNDLEAKKTEGYQLHKLILTNLYHNNILLHYNQAHGTIEFYKLSLDKIKRLTSAIDLDAACEYSVQVADNLVVIVDIGKGGVSVYDVKDTEEYQNPLCKDVDVDLSFIESYLSDYTEVLYHPTKEEEDGLLIDSKLNAKSIEDSNLSEELKTVLKFSNKQEPIHFQIKDCVYVDHNVTFCLNDNQFYTYALNKVKYLHTMDKKINGIINIMRRNNTRAITLGAIKYIIEQGISLLKLSKLFNYINKILEVSFKQPIPVSHEVKRITGIISYSKELFQPAIYLSRVETNTETLKVKY